VNGALLEFNGVSLKAKKEASLKAMKDSPGTPTCQFLQLSPVALVNSMSFGLTNHLPIDQYQKRGTAMLKILFACFVVVLSFNISLAQKETQTGVESVKDIDLLRRDLRAEKKQLVALNLPLTEAEATRFWPVYDQYVADITKVYDEFYKVVKEFAAVQKTVTDEQASSMIRRWAELMVQVHQTRQRYIPIVEKVIPPKKAAIFFQIDRRLYALIDLQVVSETPLIGQ